MSLRGGADLPVVNKHLEHLHLKAESPLPRSPGKTFPAPKDLATDGHWAIAAHGGAGAISDTASIPARYMIESGEGVPLFILAAFSHLRQDRRSTDFILGCVGVVSYYCIWWLSLLAAYVYTHACCGYQAQGIFRCVCIRAADALQRRHGYGCRSRGARFCMHTHISLFAYRTYTYT